MRIKILAVFVTLGVVAGSGGIAVAATTISPTYPGAPGGPPVVRDTSITITTMPVAVTFSRSSATANYAVTSPLVAGSAIGCRGDLGAIGAPGAGNNSPRTSVKVTGPGGIVVLDTLSPVIDTTIPGAIAGYPPLATQPAPSATNYRGGAPSGTAGNTRPLVNTVNLSGKPSGIYTVTTITQNMVKTGTLGACSVGTATVGTTTSTPGLKTDTQTFEYRPWQHVFTDVFGGGGVNMNITPKEFQAKVGPQIGAIYDGSAYMSFYTLPSGAPGLMLPSDPAGCASAPASCLPTGAVQCQPPACKPRIVTINHDGPGDRVQGVFDLNTKAFIAIANVEGFQRVLMSLGTSNDAMYHDLLAKLAAQAAGKGVDLMRLLATKVRVRTGTDEITLSLLNGLQIQPKSAGKAGIQIVSDFTVQAGLILNIYSKLGGPVCAVNKGDSDPATPAPDRYKPLTDSGYTVERSDLLPSVPRVGPLGALVGGPIYHIKGDFESATPALINTSTAVIGVDSAADEPNGYPVWVEPFLSTPAHSTVARTMDFLGTATWSASETPVTGLGCLTVDFLLGAGVALYNNPIDVGFGDIPIWNPQSPAVAGLIAQINAAVQDAADQVSSNPTVAGALQTVLDALPL